MRKFLGGLFFLLLVAAGLGYLLYPILTDQYSKYQKTEKIDAYLANVEAMDASKREEILSAAERYNESLNAILVLDVFSKNQTAPAIAQAPTESPEPPEETPEPETEAAEAPPESPEPPEGTPEPETEAAEAPPENPEPPEETPESETEAAEAPPESSEPAEKTPPAYQQQLRTNSGVMGILEIPRLGIRLPFYHLYDGKSVHDEVVHLEGTSLPVGGKGSHCVIAGPGVQPAPEGVLRDIGLTSARMLGDIGKLTAGDLFILKVADRTMLYQVARVWSVSSNVLDQLEMEPGEDIVTLMTADKDQRQLVQGRRIEISRASAELDAAEVATVPPDWLNIIIFGSPVLLVGFMVMFVIERVKQRSFRLPGEKKKRNR